MKSPSVSLLEAKLRQMTPEPADFEFDVFLSHSSKDKAVVRAIARRLRASGLRVWFDAWEIRPGDHIPAKIEHGLESSRVLVLCMSANSLGSDWAELEAGTFRFRDPLNKERRFIPLRLDESTIKGTIAQFLYIDWVPRARKSAYAKLLVACQPPTGTETSDSQHFEHIEDGDVLACAFDRNGTRAFTGGAEGAVRLWDVETARCLRVLKGHAEHVWGVAWSADQRYALSGSDDKTVRLWDLETGRCQRVFRGHTDDVTCVAWSADQRYVLSGSTDTTVRLWNAETGDCIRVLEARVGGVWGLAMSGDQRFILSGSRDGTAQLWDVGTGDLLRVLEGHTSELRTVVWSPDQRYALSGAGDGTLRLWDVESGKCLRVLEDGTDYIWSVAWSANQHLALSCSLSGTVSLWDLETGKRLNAFETNIDSPRAVAWSIDRRRAIVGGGKGAFRVLDMSDFVTDDPVSKPCLETSSPTSDQIQYTNAKVLIVGESGAGKTGLSKVLAGEQWQPSDSTVGAWATQWKLPLVVADGVEREIWLWDFGGQADQRLIHQLYFDETAAAVLVFDGQKDDVFETLGQWDRDITRASGAKFSKLLVAGRIDAGGLRVSRSQLEAFANERGFAPLLETSAKTGTGCEALRQTLISSINWENIPWRSSPRLFKRLKEEIVLLKDEGHVLMRFKELRETLRLRLSGEITRFTDAELKAVVGLLAGPGVLWELEFGSWVLLQPERINAYAQAVIQTMREDEHERGCIAEERVLNGDLTYRSSALRLDDDEERFVLLAMHKTLVERGLCLREHTDHGPLLIFPSYYRRERAELVGHPAVLVSYRFNGFFDDVYATLVVRLHHTKPFKQDELWRYAADFKTLGDRQLGVKLIRLAEGAAELQLYFDPVISIQEKIIFSKYVHEHLLEKASDVVRLRHYVCPHCHTPVGNREVAMERLAEGKRDIGCLRCDDPQKRVPLWDELEQLFGSEEVSQKVRHLQRASAIVLDNESKERALVGEVISTVALAGQICREFNVSDHGIDMEIEFKSDAGQATGKKVYLQLKSGDSHLETRKSDGAEFFSIREPRHARYWREQAFPVLLVIRSSEGNIRWMDVRDYLERESGDGKKSVKRIAFAGERFDVMSVRRWRDLALRDASL